MREWNYERTKALEGVLATMQKNGEIYVLKERNQSCFHITIRNAKTSWHFNKTLLNKATNGRHFLLIKIMLILT